MTQAAETETQAPETLDDDSTLVKLSDGREYLIHDIVSVEYNGVERDYAILLPEQDPDAETVSALLTRFDESGADPNAVFAEIEDEAEFAHIVEAVTAMYAEENEAEDAEDAEAGT